MKPDNQHILWVNGDHPSLELLEQYQEETLPPALVHQVEQHLLDCRLCSDLVEAQALSETSRIDVAEKEINQRIAATFKRKNQKALPVYFTDWCAAAVLALILCTSVLVLYYNYQEVKQQGTGIASEKDQSIQDAMDLSKRTDVTAPTELAEAAPDTVRPSVVNAPAPVTLSKKLVSPIAPEVQQEIELEVADEEVIETENLAVVLPVQVTETKSLLARQQRAAFSAEPTDVSKALQGRVAGVALGETNAGNMKRVQGQVLTPEGQPLPGVAVSVKGTTTGVATDAQGNFTIYVPAEKSTLVFRYIGYETAEKAYLANAEDQKVNLYPDNKALSEVVVTGYSTSKVNAPETVPAQPITGKSAYKRYLKDNIRYSTGMKKGKVIVRATVSPTGALQNVRVIKSLCPACDEEAIRLVEQGPSWQPATRADSSVAQEVRITVRFRP